MPTKVKITLTNSRDLDFSHIRVDVDEKELITGCVGGEPEDNSVYRDYDWIIPALEMLAMSLGATVEVVEPD